MTVHLFFRFLKFCTLGLISLILAFAFAEALLFLSEEYGQEPDFLKIHAIQHSRLYDQWNSGKKDLLSPPFNLITNVGWNDPERLKEVYKYSHLPPHFHAKGMDFLNANPTPYTVSINSMGYRSPELSQQKLKNEIRILALGGYMTFGHGVNDNETFTSRAEKILNEEQNAKKYVFINGGIHTGSLILGLSRLQADLDIIKPDYVIFEYGFNDPFLGKVDVIPDDYNKLAGYPETEHDRKSSRRNLQPWYRTNSLFVLLGSYLRKSLLYQKYLLRTSDDQVNKDNFGIKIYFDALTTSTKNLSQRGIKVIWLMHPLLRTFDNSPIESLAKESGATLIKSYDYFLKHPPDEKDWVDFEGDPENFLSEMGMNRNSKHTYRSFKIYGPYMQSTLQLSPKGQSLIAQELAEYFQKPKTENLK